MATRAVLALAIWLAVLNGARAETCARADFEAVVDEASATLVALTQKNTPVFQAKLRALRTKRGWSQEQLIQEGAPLVRDETIAGFDKRSEELLAKINSQGGNTADCKVLAELRGAMAALLETQTAKWTYMFDKIDRELAK